MSMKTPCILVCSLDEVTGLCMGCGRSLEEIGGWTSYSDAQRERLMAQLPTRLKKLEHRHSTLADATPC